MGGRQVTRYKRGASSSTWWCKPSDAGRTTQRTLSAFFVRGRADTMIPLSALVRYKKWWCRRELNHFGQRRGASITPIWRRLFAGPGLQFMEATAAKVLKPGYATD